MRQFGVPNILKNTINEHLQHAPAKAADVKRLSDLYIHDEGVSTPWSDPGLRQAYLSYFLPLNAARVCAVIQESLRALPWENIPHVIDFGSGPGTVHWVLEDLISSPLQITCIETAATAIQWHQDGAQKQALRHRVEWARRWTSNIPGGLGIFSYSLLEAEEMIPRLFDFDHLIVIEPSTRTRGRRLMELRARLIEGGFHILAPCTHQAACPLLAHSRTDWCHDRIHFERPDWVLNLEAELPFSNQTLTFSYLVASKVAAPPQNPHFIRVIGDTLVEKGKTRQMVCRGSEREFFSWLKKEGPAPLIPHGALVDLREDPPVKGNELRVGRDLKTI